MLYSAEYNFIYSKSVKTASTSAEAALEYLIRGEVAPHRTNSILYPDGSRIGYRGNNKSKDPNFNTPSFSWHHASLKEIRELIGADRFQSALKISSIRNPYDRCISAFHYNGKQELSKCIDLKNAGEVDQIREEFAAFLAQDKYSGRQHFCCDSKMAIDGFIKQEAFSADLAAVLARLNVASEIVDKILSDIPAFKTSGRSESALTLADYFSGESLEIVNKRFSDWFVWGGYVMAESLVDLEGL